MDEALRKQVRREVRDILKFTGSTAVFVTHDQDEALFMGDYVAVLDQGALQQAATPEEIYHAPATRFVAEFIGIADFLPVGYEDGRLRTAVGDVQWTGEPPGEGAEVLLRPDDMSLTPSENGQGIVMERVFQGPTYLYEVALDNGRTGARLAAPHASVRRWHEGGSTHRGRAPACVLRGGRARRVRAVYGISDLRLMVSCRWGPVDTRSIEQPMISSMPLTYSWASVGSSFQSVRPAVGLSHPAKSR